MARNTKWWLVGGGAALAGYALHRSVARATEPAALAVGTALDADVVVPIEPASSVAHEPPASSVPVGRGVSRAFDATFREYGGGLPVAYLRALAKRESNLNPREQKDPAWGLLQVIEVVRRDFNDRHRTRYAREDLLDPRINVTIASDLLRRIIASYARNHPSVPNLRADWNNPRFVELLTFGWNAGYSERGGVGLVAHYLERQGRHQDITIDTIHATARAAGASRHLSDAKKVAWCKGVARLYFAEKARDARERKGHV